MLLLVIITVCGGGVNHYQFYSSEMHCTTPAFHFNLQSLCAIYQVHVGKGSFVGSHSATNKVSSFTTRLSLRKPRITNPAPEVYPMYIRIRVEAYRVIYRRCS